MNKSKAGIVQNQLLMCSFSLDVCGKLSGRIPLPSLITDGLLVRWVICGTSNSKETSALGEINSRQSFYFCTTHPPPPWIKAYAKSAASTALKTAALSPRAGLAWTKLPQHRPLSLCFWKGHPRGQTVIQSPCPGNPWPLTCSYALF